MYVPEFTSLQNCNCSYRFKVMENLMQLIAKNNMELMMKIRILTQGSLRKKLMLYFSILSREQHSATITLPFGRDKLANYLFCDRSAVSRELGRMDREGLIQLGKTNHALIILHLQTSSHALVTTISRNRLPAAPISRFVSYSMQMRRSGMLSFKGISNTRPSSSACSASS